LDLLLDGLGWVGGCGGAEEGGHFVFGFVGLVLVVRKEFEWLIYRVDVVLMFNAVMIINV